MSLDLQVAEMRQFNRFYTRLIGVLDEGHLASKHSLVEVRVLYELAHGAGPTATALCDALALDPGYTSRILRGLQAQNLVSRRRSPADGRQVQLELTARGKRLVTELDRKAAAAIEATLAPIPVATRAELTAAMQRIRNAFEPARAAPVYVLRMPGPGDLGWIVHRHGVLYAQEYGWDERFEGLVARVVADFTTAFDGKRERCWIAEREARIVGSVFLVQKSATIAQLRLLYVEPSARGLGIGARLVQECTRFAQQARYRKIVLWTNSVLASARKIYEAEGYRLVEESPHAEFGTELVGQTWELDLVHR
ncbi:MAG: bifunctional helix-turn-helix transcriptional regulator/GNAT family N-acetyltransferase [Kofleriaceae bacterium]